MIIIVIILIIIVITMMMIIMMMTTMMMMIIVVVVVAVVGRVGGGGVVAVVVVIVVVVVVVVVVAAVVVVVVIIALKGANRNFYNLFTAPQTVSDRYSQVARTQSCANHVQHIECLPRATCVQRATWYEGTAQLSSLTEIKSHLFELYLIG